MGKQKNFKIEGVIRERIRQIEAKALRKMRHPIRNRALKGMTDPPKKYQFVNWYPRWQGFNFHRFDPEKTSWAYIYEWLFNFGFWELRKWSTLKAPPQNEWPEIPTQ